MNKTLPIDSNFPVLNSNSTSVHALERLLRDALSLRVQNIPELHRRSPSGAKVAVLFSGGLDCTVLARLAHDLLPADEPIDLLNVAFENPRVVTAAAAAHRPKIKSLSRLPEVYDDCPDRKTGRSSYEELCRVCPGRKWRFISINIPYSDTLAHRDQIKRLMRPHNTEMDLSIACALYFASRGEGVVDSGPSDNGDESAKGVPYSTSARVLLSGLGADEVFAGYTRHATAFSRSGYKGLIDEIDLDVGRLGKRNLGRDDRIISHWGREARYPYLDEDFLAWALQCPVWEKCGFRNGLDGAVSGAKEKTAAGELEPGKQALRLVAWNLGMKNVAREKKRAIQFGSRTAKMESGRSKGTSLIS
jgi:asparagine synthetase B (glutamine-hydrolysing)